MLCNTICQQSSSPPSISFHGKLAKLYHEYTDAERELRQKIDTMRQDSATTKSDVKGLKPQYDDLQTRGSELQKEIVVSISSIKADIQALAKEAKK